MNRISGLLHLDDMPVKTRDPDHRLASPAPAGLAVIAADVRLDNRPELAAALSIDPERARRATDAELILAAYERWGEACPERLLGDFAFAIRDDRRQALFCARDPLGVRPLYYHASPRFAAVATGIRALLAIDGVPRRLDETRIADFLAASAADRESTFYRDIRRLPAGHALTIEGGRTVLRRHWSLDPRRELRLGSDEAYAAAFLEAFERAVARRLRAGGETGTLLSGGLDSSAITCMARRLLGRDGLLPLRAYSAVFDDLPECDERRFIEAAVRGGGLEPRFVPADRIDPIAAARRAIEHLGEPIAAPNFHIHHALLEAAAGDGTRVLLDGLDGDTTVSHGISRLEELARSGRWLTLAREIAGLRRSMGLGRWRLIRRHGIRPLIPAPLRDAWSAARGAVSRDTDLVHPDLARRVGLEERRRALEAAAPAEVPAARADHWRRLSSGLVPHLLELLAGAGGALGVRPEFPFFDRELVELCLAFPSEQKLRGGRTRVVMREALRGLLPDEIRRRGGKSDLGPALPHALLARGPEAIEEILFQRGREIEGYADIAALRAAYQRLAAGRHRRRADRRREKDAIAVWRAAVLAMWLMRKPASGQAPRWKESASHE